MKTLILDGSHANDPVSTEVLSALSGQLRGRGWDAEHILLRERKIGNCAGDFFCWVRSPGVCNINDDNRVIAAQMMQADLVIYLTPVTFGGYSSQLKRMVDHQIQNILPFFEKVGGEIHHQKRYEAHPNLLVIGWMESPDAQAEAVFRRLVMRNAINLCARTSVCGLVLGDPSADELADRMAGWLDDIAGASDSPVPVLPPVSISLPRADAPQRAVLLVGSPRTKNSTSSSLGSYLMEQLAMRGVQTETIQIYTSLNAGERTQSMLTSIDAADLVVLAFPLYVDSLPAPVITLLERIAVHRAGKQTTQRFAAIANCGFPEAQHNLTALAICATFARQAGFVWAGSLGLGGGEGLVHGTPLHQLDGRAIRLKKSLGMAAEALAAGSAFPQTAAEAMERPSIPTWLYLLVGNYGWKRQAKKYGMAKRLRHRPYRDDAVGSPRVSR